MVTGLIPGETSVQGETQRNSKVYCKPGEVFSTVIAVRRERETRKTRTMGGGATVVAGDNQRLLW